MAKTYDVIVLGLGAMGAAATYQLALRGAAVLGLDQLTPPHDQGSTHGDTRITRLACGEGAQYTPFVQRSHQIWRSLEEETGRQLLRQNGVVVIAGAGEVAPTHGVAKFLEATVEAAKAWKVEHEVIDGPEITRRFPAFKVAASDQAYHDRLGGFVRPENCIAAQLSRARARGAELNMGEKVRSFRQEKNGVVVDTALGTYRAKTLIVAAGPWLPGFLEPPLARQFGVTRQVLYWFRAKSPDDHAGFAPEHCPVFIWQPSKAPGFYGFPAIGSFEEGVKIATEDHDVVDPERVDRTVSPREVKAMVEIFRPFLPGLSDRCVKAKVCLYTEVNGARFILDRLPGSPNIIVASPCSGHGFKHSGGIGDALAQMALGEKKIVLGGQTIDMTPFALRADDPAWRA
ncbi:MAG TPA: N-methyl-L-tryptophan oxidase [Reyranella sp.]|nr:N-methyl-L-tryptophan oxidase [Reyranella sp.]